MICQCRRWWARSRLLQYRTLLLCLLLICLFCFAGLHWDHRVYEQALRRRDNITRALEQQEKVEVQAVFGADVMRIKPRASQSSATDTPQTRLPQHLNYSVPELEEELEARRQRVWEVCAKRQLYKDGEPNAWEFFIDEHHHLIWCNIFKAASSSWMYNFNLLGGYKEQYLKRTRKTPLLLARAKFPRPSVPRLLHELPRSLSFLIVRDPFERLLSAYRNKIENFKHKFYRRLALSILKSYPQVGKHSKNARGPSFQQFVKYVIDTAKGNKSDEHWAPYYRFCTPCHVNFTVVAKTETLNRDQDYIIKKAGIQEIVKPQVINVAAGLKTEEVLYYYFKQLDEEVLNDLYEIYKVDFEMFDYNANKYFNMVAS